MIFQNFPNTTRYLAAHGILENLAVLLSNTTGHAITYTNTLINTIKKYEIQVDWGRGGYGLSNQLACHLFYSFNSYVLVLNR